MEKVTFEQLGDVAAYFWGWLVGIKYWNSPEGWAARLAIWLLVFYILILLAKHMLELLVKIHDSWKHLGLPVAGMTSEMKAEIRRRQQFGNVLLADLAHLAKAEQRNDQFFTELEAEVEAEGRYYAGTLARILRRPSVGLRREHSLTEAIEASLEPFLLLVGEPGSGKSVAMRHLAHRLAQRLAHSHDPSTPIPLYLNMKELGEAPPGGPTADFIRQFVIDNIRRGDADTADYVREHWDNYRERGLWMFLLDSFDEIPAILHSPSGCTTIQDHGEAIRQFLTGMGKCRGVLASREYKGPDSLPWTKFRILSLSTERQEELVNNSFLTTYQKEIVRQHLAVQGSSLQHTPLFLTLLCRYVKEEGTPPINDYDLLNRHLVKLSNREPDYIQSNYHLSSAQLLQGATQLAVLFATQPELSLAPTQDQIAASLEPNSKIADCLEDLLGALMEVKIGRSDVAQARAGDRRFSFAHRRYQETLFVSYLAEHPFFIPPEDLLSSVRWRDYTVTLLQTRSPEDIRLLVDEAIRLLNQHAERQHPVHVLAEFDRDLVYYEWENEPAVHLLRLLQEGFARRIGDIPGSLSQAVAGFLQPRWENGDELDRSQVLVLGGLLPRHMLLRMIEYAVEDGSRAVAEAAFMVVPYLGEMPQEVLKWVCRRVSDAAIDARKKQDVFRIKAFVGRLPSSSGAEYVVDRSLKIGLFTRFLPDPSELFNRVFGRLGRLPTSLGRSTSSSLGTSTSIYACTLPVVASVQIAWMVPSGTNITVAVLFTIVSILLIFYILCRDVGHKLNVISLPAVAYRRLMQDGDTTPSVVRLSTVTIVLTIVLALITILVLTVAPLFGWLEPTLLSAFLVSLFGLFFVLLLALFWRRASLVRHMRSVMLAGRGLAQMLGEAQSLFDVAMWISFEGDKLFTQLCQIRSLIRLLSVTPSGASATPIELPVTALGRTLLIRPYGRRAALDELITLYEGKKSDR